MPITPSTAQHPRAVGRTISGNEMAFGPGTKVSLNLTKRSFLATPRREFCLTEQNPTGTIPFNASEGVLAALKVALDREEIVIGHQPIPRAARRGLLEPVYETIDRAESVEQVRQTILGIASGKTRMDRHPPVELIRWLAVHEAEHGCRAPFLDFFGTILEKIPGVGAVEEHPQDRSTARLRTGSDGVAVAAAPGPRSPEQQKALKDLI